MLHVGDFLHCAGDNCSDFIRRFDKMSIGKVGVSRRRAVPSVAGVARLFERGVQLAHEFGRLDESKGPLRPIRGNVLSLGG